MPNPTETDTFESGSAASWREALAVYARPRVIAMFFLGFSAGLPYMLVFATLTFWLREEGLSRSLIGLFSWIGITYSIKFAWAPIIDRLPVYGLTVWLGKRRSWMLVGQLGIATGLIGIALTDPARGLAPLAGFALLVAFSSATQDISVDAYRIEAEARNIQGAMAGTYQAGYRLAILAAYSGALFIAELSSWTGAYLAMAALMSVGMVTVLVIAEPAAHIGRATVQQEQRVIDYMARSEHLPRRLRQATAWFIGAVICPFIDFFQRNGWLALGILLFVATFRISDITLAGMANPLYVDLGFTKGETSLVGGVYGLIMTITGAGLGGLTVIRHGIMRPLLVGAVAVAATNLLFAYMATLDKNLGMLAVVISADNLSGGFAGSVFIAYLSSLTNTAYTATQYALFSSLMTLPGKIISGFSGFIVDAAGYPLFFIYASVLGVPAILLVLYLMHAFNADRNAELDETESISHGISK